MDSPATLAALPERDLLITAVETNDHHGVGILLQRLFADTSGFVHLRTSSLYPAEPPIPGSHHELCSRYLTVSETKEHLSRILRLYRIRRILCVPYYREEFVHAVLAKELTGAPLCTYLMDDQNVFATAVPDQWVARLLEASDLRLGISPELCLAYATKFGRQLHLLPPVVERPTPLVPCYWEPEPGEPIRAAMLGNVWTKATFQKLRDLLRTTGLHLDWYGNGSRATWLEGSPEEWEADHVRCMGHLPEADLVASLASYPFILVPSGSMDADDDNPAFSRLSLPSRLLFCHARTDTPVLILGSPETPAGRLVRQVGSGVCADYEARSLLNAVTTLTSPAVRIQQRRVLRQIHQHLVLEKGGEWIWESLRQGQPQPAAFHAAFPRGQKPPPWLDTLNPAPTRAPVVIPHAGARFGDDVLPAFSILRRPHHDLLKAEGIDLPALEDIELPEFAAGTAAYLLDRLVKPESDLLFLGRRMPPALNCHNGSARIWHIDDLAGWQRDGYPGETRFIKGATPYPGGFPQFDAFVSTGWLGELPDDQHALEGLSLYLEACARPGALHLHFFAGVRHPSHFWQPPALDYLRRRFSPYACSPSLDQILCTEDAFALSEAVYDRTWSKATRKTYAEFGAPLGLLVSWRKGSTPR